MNRCPNRRTRARVVALACAAVWLTSAAASAQSQQHPSNPSDLRSLSLEELGRLEVVYGASKHEQPVSDAPSSVTLITREDIRTFGYRSVADLLEAVRGAYVTSDDAYPYTGLRGINRPGDFGGRVLVTIDGHRINEPLYDSNFVGSEFPVDVDLIERVEIIRGAGSSLFGSNAFFAIVNIITRRPHEVPGTEVSAAAGSHGGFDGRYTYGRTLDGRTGVLFSVSAHDQDGRSRVFYPEFEAVNGGVAEDMDGERRASLFGSVNRGELTVRGAFGGRSRHVSAAPFGTAFNDPRFGYLDQRGYVAAEYLHNFDVDRSIRLTVSYDHYRFEGTYPYAYDDGSTMLNMDWAGADTLGGEVQFNRTLRKQHRITAGTEVRAHVRLDLVNRDEEPDVTEPAQDHAILGPHTHVDSRRSAAVVGLFLQDEWAVRPNLLVNAGVRYDHYSTFGGTVNPRAAVIYTPSPGKTLKAIYGQAFRAPNAYELFYEQVAYKANPALQPETVRSVEGVYEQRLSRTTRLALTTFLIDVNNLIGVSQDPADGLYTFSNESGLRSVGAEAELSGHWGNGIRGDVNYTFARSRDDLTGIVLLNSPRHVTKGRLVAPLWRERLIAGVEVQALSARRTVLGRNADPFWLANLTLTSRRLARRVDVSATVYNLFGVRYGDPMSDEFRQEVLMQPGRTFRVKVTFGR